MFSFFAFILLCGSVIYAQTPYYYYYKGEKQYLNIDRSKLFISVVDTAQLNLALDIKKSKFLGDIPVNRQVRQEYTKRYWQELTLQNSLSASQYQSKVSLIKQNNVNAVVSPYFTNQSGEKIGLSNFFYVKLKTLSDTTVLKQQASIYNATVVSQDKFMPLWFVVSVTSTSNYNAMELSNIFYESGLFRSTEPDFMVENLSACVNDTYFNDQWGLKNSGQSDGMVGIDIKACDAWQISTGTNVVVAVLDEGIELNHPDLATNIYPQSYDTESGTSPSKVFDGHGTACAGIIGAVKNNNVGVAGVAPNCKLMSISNSLYLSTLSKQQFANGINWAWKNGADVISNSWGHSVLAGELINNAIDSAIIRGRNAKGTIVVFSSGNSSDSCVSYPANLSNVIAVGAINRDGKRANFSDYGNTLDIVAPGVSISTTDRQGRKGYNFETIIDTHAAYTDYSNRDYTGKFGGTSAACPHVAGVAALVLSINPDLTGQQVRNIIESTAQKIRQGTGTEYYNYQTTTGRPNGTWNNEMGYGLVNAHAAVRKAVLSLPPFISGPASINCNKTSFSINRNSCLYYEWTASSGIQIVSGQGTDSITVKGTSYNANGWIEVFVVTGGVYANGTAEYYILRKNITVRTPSSYAISRSANICSNSKKMNMNIMSVQPEADLCDCPYWWKTTAGTLTVNTIIPALSPQADMLNEDVETDVIENEIAEYVVESVAPASRIVGGGPTIIVVSNNRTVQTKYYEEAVLDFTGITGSITVSCYLENPRLSGSDASPIASFTFNPSSYIYNTSYSPSNRTIILSQEQLSSSEYLGEPCQLQLHLYNDSGYISTVEFSSGESIVSIPLNSLPAGNYYINVVDCNGNVVESKAIPAF
jgi:subtilisin family serine protease